MLKDRLMELRRLNGLSQEDVAKRIGISRQAYAKWEQGSTAPGIEKAASLAMVYGITLDELMDNGDGRSVPIPPAPPGKNIWGTVTVGERGQIVIPKAARDRFGLKHGDRLIVASDEVGIALLPAEFFERMMQKGASSNPDGR